MTADRVGVIGGGLGGLAAACTLAARGHAVVLFEQSAGLGGKAAVLEADGYRFDMGPTILTLPSVLARVFAEAGEDLADWLDLVPLDPQWRCFFADGGVAQMIDHFTQYVGSAPDASPAVLCGIAHMQTAGGVWYPRGGTGAVPRALVRLAEKLGVEVRTECGVRRIVLNQRGAAAGI